MSCFGKVLGFIVGSVFEGPLGALIGCWVGHQLLDRYDDTYEREAQDKQNAFIACYFGCLAKMAKADGQVSQDEITLIERIMKELNLDQDQQEWARNIFRKAKGDHFTARDYLSQFSQLIQYDPNIAQMLIFALIRVAVVDGNLSQAELDILYQAEQILNLPRGLVDAMLAEITGCHYSGQRSYAKTVSKDAEELASAYQILGCKETDSNEVIKRIYRQRCLDNHPDRLQHKGLPKEFIETAKEQMILINQSYDKICRSRGMK